MSFFFLKKKKVCCSRFRLQLIAIYCNRQGVWTAHFIRHFFSCSEHALIVAHHTAWLKNVLVRVMSSTWSSTLCGCPFLGLSVLHFVLFRVFLLSFLLLPEPWAEPLLPCGCHRGNIPLALRQMRSLAPWPKALFSHEMLILGTYWKTWYCYGQWTNLHDRSQNGPKRVANDYLVWSLTFIVHVNTNNIVMWETLPNNAGWDFFKTPILREILRIQNLHQVEHCAFWEVICLFQSVGCGRNKLQFRAVQQNQKWFLWTQDWGWTVYPHLIYGIWSSQFFTETRISVIKNGETRARTYVRFVQHLTNFKRERKLMEWLMI